MPKIKYEVKRFTGASLSLIKQANAIIAEYTRDGYVLTLRQLYYQFVARGLIENSMKSYRKIGNIVNNGRLAGKIDWRAIVDRTRNLKALYHSIDAPHAVRQASETFQIDMWRNQPHRIEIWIEKEALVGVLERVCDRNDVPYFACKGYNSQSEQWRAARRLLEHKEDGYKPVIIHLGDHDPSGIDASRDIDDRFTTFMGGAAFERIALNMDQVDELQPPENPAKLTDPRGSDYLAAFGESSWELDALPPAYLDNLIQETIDRFKDPDKWDAAEKEQEHALEVLHAAADQWGKVEKALDMSDYRDDDDDHWTDDMGDDMGDDLVDDEAEGVETPDDKPKPARRPKKKLPKKKAVKKKAVKKKAVKKKTTKKKKKK